MKKLLLALVFTCISLNFISAHPHIWAQTQLEFDFDGETCMGFWVTWDFDKMFSLSIIQVVDADGNGSLDKNEIEKLYHYAFENLENYGYFVLLRVGEKRFAPKRVERFNAWIRDGVLTYRFFVPLDKDALGPSFYVAIFDTTFFTDIGYIKPEAQITQRRVDSPLPQWNIAINKNYPVYYDPRGAATDLAVYSKWQPGLETVYPREIHVYF